MDQIARPYPLARLFAASENTEPPRPPTEAELDRFAALMADVLEDRWDRRDVGEIDGGSTSVVA